VVKGAQLKWFEHQTNRLVGLVCKSSNINT